MDLAEAATDVVLPALRAVLRDDELDSLDLTRSDEMGGSLALTVVVCGETYRDLVVQGGVPDMSAEQWRERLRANLVDFVAESRFGWGQNRDSR